MSISKALLVFTNYFYTMKRFTNFIICLLVVIQGVGAQKSMEALRIEEEIVVDGILDEAVWESADIAHNFITTEPTFGNKVKQDTEVKILYDDEAIYVGVFMEEVSRDSIMTELTQRDDLGNTDHFGVILDTYGKGNDGFLFFVGASGTQFDAKILNSGNSDSSWDGVWFSEVLLNEKGWYVEMKLPYSALRFPKKDVQDWIINFERNQKKNNTKSFWNPINPAQDGVFNQCGRVTNIKNIKPPIRLSFSPYASAYTLRNRDQSNVPTTNVGYSYNGGMDVKYGINDAFTLDMTLIPDFGQVESDDQVVNLSPFEIRFDEKRPFFTEGLELFEKGDVFYSRRVGGTPLKFYEAEDDLLDNEIIKSNPQAPQLYNASKISGRTNSGLGIGLFNALEAGAHAVITDTISGEERLFETHSLANYNVTVLDQTLKYGSHVAVTNTNVSRKGDSFYDANVTAVDFRLRDKNQKYNFQGSGAFANQFFDDGNNSGHKLELGFGKNSGKWNYYGEYAEASKDYDENDLGFSTRTNFRNFDIGGSFNQYKPFSIFNEVAAWASIETTRLMDPGSFVRTDFNLGGYAQTKKFLNFNPWLNLSSESYDFWEPRTDGRYVITPAIIDGGLWVGTDGRKKVRVSTSFWAYSVNETGRDGFGINFGPRIRFNDQFTLSTHTRFSRGYKDTGWVSDGENGEIYFGQRTKDILQNRINLFYNITSNMGFNARIRHYWFKAVYTSFHELSDNGELTATDFSDVPDFTEQFFNVDVSFNWRFAPGSDIILNWKNNISGYHEGFGQSNKDWSYTEGIRDLNQLPTNNSISLRIVYFLDYNTVQHKIKKKRQT